MQTLYTVEQVRAIEARAIARMQDGGAVLMRKAGERVAREIQTRWPDARTAAVVAGPGNNGGDGWVVARLLAEGGVDVTVYEWDASAKGDAAAMREAYLAAGYCAVACAQFPPASVPDILVDALFGSGLSRALEGEALRLVEAMNALAAAEQSKTATVAVDVPSGLNADTGSVGSIGAAAEKSVAVHADLTVTFIGQKRGLHTGVARDYCGEIVLDDLGVTNRF